MEDFLKALVADDDQTHREIFADLMNEEGMEVDAVSNGLQALDMIQGNTYDVVLSDLIMPGKDGIEVLRAAKTKSENTLVIIITGFGTMETAVEAIKLGAHDYITKPFKLEELQLLFRNVKEKIFLVRSNKELKEKLDYSLKEIEMIKRERQSLMHELAETRKRMDEYEHNLSALLHQFPFLLNPKTPIIPLEKDKETAKIKPEESQSQVSPRNIQIKV